MRSWKNENGKIDISFCYRFIWSDVRQLMEELSYPFEQYEYLIDVASTYNTLAHSGKMHEINNDSTFVDCINTEMKRLKVTIELQKKNTSNRKSNLSGNHKEAKVQLPDIIDSFIECLTVLKNIESPVIDSNNKYILGKNSKGAIVAWIDTVKLRGKLKGNPSEDQIAEALKTFFQMDSLTGRTLRGNNTEAYNNYIREFKLLIKE